MKDTSKASDIGKLLIATTLVAIGVTVFKSDTNLSWFGPSTVFGHLLLGLIASTLLFIAAGMLKLTRFKQYLACALMPAMVYIAWIVVAGSLLLNKNGLVGHINYFGLTTIPIALLTCWYWILLFAGHVYHWYRNRKQRIIKCEDPKGLACASNSNEALESGLENHRRYPLKKV